MHWSGGREGQSRVPPRDEMVGPTVMSPPLERLDGERPALVAWLAHRFRGRLTFEDAEDVVAEALPRLAEDPHLPADRERAGAYVRRALWRDALDELRHRHGRDLARREPVSLELAAEQAQPGAEPEAPLADRQERVQLQAASARVLARLSRSDAQVLRMKFLDDVAPDEIADELGVTRSQYQRRLTAASRRALDALVDAHSGPACPHVRRLIAEAPVGMLDRDEAGRRDAHLDECVHCRAFSLRARGALELLPLPVGLLERLSTRFGGLFGRGGESLAAIKDSPEALGGGAAGAAGAGAGTVLTAGIGAKVAIGCTGAVVAAMCAGPLGIVPRGERDPAKPAHKSHARTSTPRHVAAQPAVASPPAVFVAEARSAEQTGAGQRQTQRTRTPGRRSSAAREFGPEAAVPSRTSPTASAATSGAAVDSSPTPAYVPARVTSSSSSFAGEFAP